MHKQSDLPVVDFYVCDAMGRDCFGLPQGTGLVRAQHMYLLLWVAVSLVGADRLAHARNRTPLPSSCSSSPRFATEPRTQLLHAADSRTAASAVVVVTTARDGCHALARPMNHAAARLTHPGGGVMTSFLLHIESPDIIRLNRPLVQYAVVGMGTARPPPARFGQGLTSPHKVDGAVHVCTCRTRSQLSRRFVPIAWTLPSPIACCHFYSIAPARLPATLPQGPLRAALGGTVTPRPSTARPSPQQPSSTSLRALGGFIPAAGRACFLCHSSLSRSYYNRSLLLPAIRRAQ